MSLFGNVKSGLKTEDQNKNEKKNVDNWAWLQTCDPEYLSASLPLIIDCTSSGLKLMRREMSGAFCKV